MRCFRVRACTGIILSYSHTSGSWLIGISFDLSGSKKISSQGQSHAHALHAMAFPIDSPKWQMAIFFCDLLAHQLVQKSPCPCRPKNGSAKKSKWESGLIARCHRRVGKDQKTYSINPGVFLLSLCAKYVWDPWLCKTTSHVDSLVNKSVPPEAGRAGHWQKWHNYQTKWKRNQERWWYCLYAHFTLTWIWRSMQSEYLLVHLPAYTVRMWS